MTARIFISYRREDAAAEAGRLCTLIRDQFGEDSVFMDTSSIQAGATWPDEIQAALRAAETVVIVVGPDWLRAGSSKWGQRRIDQEHDWVREELSLAFQENKTVVPVLVRGAEMPPADVLPEPLKALPEKQQLEIRRDYWDHDVKLLLARLQGPRSRKQEAADAELGPYPRNPPIGPEPISDEKLRIMLDTDLSAWKKVITPLPENPNEVRIELFREYKFRSFQDAINFMSQVAPGCDIAIHHPRWENVWKTIRVYLTTWDIGHRVSDRDVQLARYFDRTYMKFPGATPPRSKKNIT